MESIYKTRTVGPRNMKSASLSSWTQCIAESKIKKDIVGLSASTQAQKR